MNRWLTYGLATAVTILGGFAASAAIGNGEAVASPPDKVQDVNIVSPVPVPVSGTVSAAQSGAWNVGLLGTASVNVANSPTVNINNSAAQPLFIRNADDPGRIPYQSLNETRACTGNFCQIVVAAVPAGHRLVVQHISGEVDLNSVPSSVQVSVQAQDGSAVTGSRLPAPYGDNVLFFDFPVLFYVDGGQFYVLQAFVDASTSFSTVGVQQLNAIGYLLDCNAAPCAAL